MLHKVSHIFDKIPCIFKIVSHIFDTLSWYIGHSIIYIPLNVSYIQHLIFTEAYCLAGLAYNDRFSPLCGSTPTSDNAQDLSLYDPDC